jgi:heptosyltransferase-2
MKKTKFLILRFSSIGDIVLTTPVMRCIKTQYPNAEVHFATKESFKVLVENNPYIDRYHLLGKSLNELIENLQTEKFDFIIDLHNNLRTSIIKLRLFSVKSFSFDKLNFKKWLLVNLKINQIPNLHIVDRYLETVKSLGVKNDSKGLDYFIPEKDKLQINETYVAYAIGGQHFTKKLPTNRIIEVCQKIDGKIRNVSKFKVNEQLI